MDTTRPKPTLEQLLRRGDIWRGQSQVFAPHAVVATGHSALDEKLLNKGWPTGCLIECGLANVYSHTVCGAEWLLLAPAITHLCSTGYYLVLLNPPATPLAAGLIHQGIALNQLLVVEATNNKDFVAAFTELSRSPHCAVLLAWQPSPTPTYTELRKCQLACADSGGLRVLLRSHKTKKQSSPAPLRMQAHLQKESLQVDIFKQKGKFHSGTVVIPLPEDWLPRSEPSQTQQNPAAARMIHLPRTATAIDQTTVVSLPFNRTRYEP